MFNNLLSKFTKSKKLNQQIEVNSISDQQSTSPSYTESNFDWSYTINEHALLLSSSLHQVLSFATNNSAKALESYEVEAPLLPQYHQRERELEIYSNSLVCNTRPEASGATTLPSLSALSGGHSTATTIATGALHYPPAGLQDLDDRVLFRVTACSSPAPFTTPRLIAYDGVREIIAIVADSPCGSSNTIEKFDDDSNLKTVPTLSNIHGTNCVYLIGCCGGGLLSNIHEQTGQQFFSSCIDLDRNLTGDLSFAPSNIDYLDMSFVPGTETLVLLSPTGVTLVDISMVLLFGHDSSDVCVGDLSNSVDSISGCFLRIPKETTTNLSCRSKAVKRQLCSLCHELPLGLPYTAVGTNDGKVLFASLAAGGGWCKYEADLVRMAKAAEDGESNLMQAKQDYKNACMGIAERLLNRSEELVAPTVTQKIVYCANDGGGNRSSPDTTKEILTAIQEEEKKTSTIDTELCSFSFSIEEVTCVVSYPSSPNCFAAAGRNTGGIIKWCLEENHLSTMFCLPCPATAAVVDMISFDLKLKQGSTAVPAAEIENLSYGGTSDTKEAKELVVVRDHEYITSIQVTRDDEYVVAVSNRMRLFVWKEKKMSKNTNNRVVPVYWMIDLLCWDEKCNSSKAFRDTTSKIIRNHNSILTSCPKHIFITPTVRLQEGQNPTGGSRDDTKVYIPTRQYCHPSTSDSMTSTSYCFSTTVIDELTLSLDEKTILSHERGVTASNTAMVTPEIHTSDQNEQRNNQPPEDILTLDYLVAAATDPLPATLKELYANNKVLIGGDSRSNASVEVVGDIHVSKFTDPNNQDGTITTAMTPWSVTLPISEKLCILPIYTNPPWPSERSIQVGGDTCNSARERRNQFISAVTTVKGYSSLIVSISLWRQGGVLMAAKRKQMRNLFVRDSPVLSTRSLSGSLGDVDGITFSGLHLLSRDNTNGQTAGYTVTSLGVCCATCHSNQTSANMFLGIIHAAKPHKLMYDIFSNEQLSSSVNQSVAQGGIYHPFICSKDRGVSGGSCLPYHPQYDEDRGFLFLIDSPRNPYSAMSIIRVYPFSDIIGVVPTSSSIYQCLNYNNARKNTKFIGSHIKACPPIADTTRKCSRTICSKSFFGGTVVISLIEEQRNTINRGSKDHECDEFLPRYVVTVLSQNISSGTEVETKEGSRVDDNSVDINAASAGVGATSSVSESLSFGRLHLPLYEALIPHTSVIYHPSEIEGYMACWDDTQCDAHSIPSWYRRVGKTGIHSKTTTVVCARILQGTVVQVASLETASTIPKTPSHCKRSPYYFRDNEGFSLLLVLSDNTVLVTALSNLVAINEEISRMLDTAKARDKTYNQDALRPIMVPLLPRLSESILISTCSLPSFLFPDQQNVVCVDFFTTLMSVNSSSSSLLSLSGFTSYARLAMFIACGMSDGSILMLDLSHGRVLSCDKVIRGINHIHNNNNNNTNSNSTVNKSTSLPFNFSICTPANGHYSYSFQQDNQAVYAACELVRNKRKRQLNDGDSKSNNNLSFLVFPPVLRPPQGSFLHDDIYKDVISGEAYSSASQQMLTPLANFLVSPSNASSCEIRTYRPMYHYFYGNIPYRLPPALPLNSCIDGSGVTGTRTEYKEVNSVTLQCSFGSEQTLKDLVDQYDYYCRQKESRISDELKDSTVFTLSEVVLVGAVSLVDIFGLPLCSLEFGMGPIGDGNASTTLHLRVADTSLLTDESYSTDEPGDSLPSQQPIKWSGVNIDQLSHFTVVSVSRSLVSGAASITLHPSAMTCTNTEIISPFTLFSTTFIQTPLSTRVFNVRRLSCVNVLKTNTGGVGDEEGWSVFQPLGVDGAEGVNVSVEVLSGDGGIPLFGTASPPLRPCKSNPLFSRHFSSSAVCSQSSDMNRRSYYFYDGYVQNMLMASFQNGAVFAPAHPLLMTSLISKVIQCPTSFIGYIPSMHSFAPSACKQNYLLSKLTSIFQCQHQQSKFYGNKAVSLSISAINECTYPCAFGFFQGNSSLAEEGVIFILNFSSIMSAIGTLPQYNGKQNDSDSTPQQLNHLSTLLQSSCSLTVAAIPICATLSIFARHNNMSPEDVIKWQGKNGKYVGACKVADAGAPRCMRVDKSEPKEKVTEKKRESFEVRVKAILRDAKAFETSCSSRSTVVTDDNKDKALQDSVWFNLADNLRRHPVGLCNPRNHTVAKMCCGGGGFPPKGCGLHTNVMSNCQTAATTYGNMLNLHAPDVKVAFPHFFPSLFNGCPFSNCTLPSCVSIQMVFTTSVTPRADGDIEDVRMLARSFWREEENWTEECEPHMDIGCNTTLSGTACDLYEKQAVAIPVDRQRPLVFIAFTTRSQGGSNSLCVDMEESFYDSSLSSNTGTVSFVRQGGPFRSSIAIFDPALGCLESGGNSVFNSKCVSSLGSALSGILSPQRILPIPTSIIPSNYKVSGLEVVWVDAQAHCYISFCPVTVLDDLSTSLRTSVGHYTAHIVVDDGTQDILTAANGLGISESLLDDNYEGYVYKDASSISKEKNQNTSIRKIYPRRLFNTHLLDKQAMMGPLNDKTAHIDQYHLTPYMRCPMAGDIALSWGASFYRKVPHFTSGMTAERDDVPQHLITARLGLFPGLSVDAQNKLIAEAEKYCNAHFTNTTALCPKKTGIVLDAKFLLHCRLPSVPSSTTAKVEKGLFKRLFKTSYEDKLYKIEDQVLKEQRCVESGIDHEPRHICSHIDATNDASFESFINRTVGEKQQLLGPSLMKRETCNGLSENKSNETKNIMNENKQKMMERGEKIGKLEQHTRDMAAEAEEFVKLTAALKKKQKSWF